jgi:hypothetical protein
MPSLYHVDSEVASRSPGSRHPRAAVLTWILFGLGLRKDMARQSLKNFGTASLRRRTATSASTMMRLSSGPDRRRKVGAATSAKLPGSIAMPTFAVTGSKACPYFVTCSGHGSADFMGYRNEETM